MNEERRDNRGRLLHVGESQRADGRYQYKYTDISGNAKFVYSWRLDKNDRNPEGKPKDLSLREKEKEVRKGLFEELTPRGGDMTVVELVEKYLSLKVNVRHNTLANYKMVLNILRKEAFGRQRIDMVKISDAKAWLIKLQKEDGRGHSTVKAIRGVVHPAFEMAFQDDLIRKNPFHFELASVVVDDSVRREALTRKQERAFLKFIREDEHFRKYYEGIFILFNTGLRISELCGLTISDIDFENNRIRVDHQLQRTREMEYVIEPTKTKSGMRYVPMSPDVAAAFRRVIAVRPRLRVETIIDGHGGFLFLDQHRMPTVAIHWEHRMKRMVEKYNSIYRVPLPKITPHVCRHTFCSNMAKSGMNPKTLQYIMGHSDISITMNVYTHLQFEDAQAEFERVIGQ